MARNPETQEEKQAASKEIFAGMCREIFYEYNARLVMEDLDGKTLAGQGETIMVTNKGR